MASELRKKRIWTVSDFATFVGMTNRQARALLKALNRELGGMLLRTNGGKKPEYTLFPAALAKAKPELFERVVSLEARVEDLEERLDEVITRERMIAAQTGQNSRDIAKMRSRAA